MCVLLPPLINASFFPPLIYFIQAPLLKQERSDDKWMTTGFKTLSQYSKNNFDIHSSVGKNIPDVYF